MKSDLVALQTLFAALADPTRLRIIGLLAAGDVCVCDIYETLKIGQPKASRHLAYLRRAGVVVADKRGLWVHYRLADRMGLAEDVLRAVRDALRSVDAVTRDADRFRRTACCVQPRQTRSKSR